MYQKATNCAFRGQALQCRDSVSRLFHNEEQKRSRRDEELIDDANKTNRGAELCPACSSLCLRKKRRGHTGFLSPEKAGWCPETTLHPCDL